MTTVIVGMSIADVDRRDEFCAAATQRGRNGRAPGVR